MIVHSRNLLFGGAALITVKMHATRQQTVIVLTEAADMLYGFHVQRLWISSTKHCIQVNISTINNTRYSFKRRTVLRKNSLPLLYPYTHPKFTFDPYCDL